MHRRSMFRLNSQDAAVLFRQDGDFEIVIPASHKDKEKVDPAIFTATLVAYFLLDPDEEMEEIRNRVLDKFHQSILANREREAAQDESASDAPK